MSDYDNSGGTMKVDVPSKHTTDMIRHEIDGMLGFGRIRLCLGHLMQLAEADSPYIRGGKVTEQDILFAMSVLRVSDMGLVDFHDALMGELDAGFRTYELFEDDGKPKDDGKRSEIAAFGPEWLADTIRGACEAVPSITLHDALWEVPFVMMMHLSVSTARKNGAITSRPKDIKAAIEAFKQMRRK